jgi:tetratricopeptide (TPR) repeat protein
MLFYHQSRPDEAIKCYDKVLEIDPVSLEAWYRKRKILQSLQKSDLDPHYQVGWYKEVALHYHAGNYDEAIKLCNRIISTYEDQMVALYNRARFKARKGEIQESIDDLKSLLGMTVDNEVSEMYFIELARQENEFEKIKDNIQFKELVNRGNLGISD